MEETRLPPHGPAILFQLGPEINELFSRPEASELIDPAVIIFTDKDSSTIHIVERLQITAALSVPEVYHLNADAETYPIIAIISDEHGGTQYTIPDPRLDPEWYIRGIPE
jgi:hypothetical protein